MFLMKLQSKEKFSFLHLAHYLARIDGVYGAKEEEIILEYCDEMGIENITSFNLNDFDLDKNLNDFKSKESKRIVLLELMILIHIDATFHINEIELIQKITEKFNISIQEVEAYSTWGKSAAILYETGKVFINKE